MMFRDKEESNTIGYVKSGLNLVLMLFKMHDGL